MGFGVYSGMGSSWLKVKKEVVRNAQTITKRVFISGFVLINRLR